MWNRRSSLILLVHIKHQKKRGWYIPIALYAVEATLESWRETLAFWESILPARRQWIPKKVRNGRKIPLSELLTLCIHLCKELRHHGRYELVGVETATERISIRLW